MCIHMYMYTGMHTCTRAHMYTYTDAYMHTCTLICIIHPTPNTEIEDQREPGWSWVRFDAG